jgi:hypothetical protein
MAPDISPATALTFVAAVGADIIHVDDVKERY